MQTQLECSFTFRTSQFVLEQVDELFAVPTALLSNASAAVSMGDDWGIWLGADPGLQIDGAGYCLCVRNKGNRRLCLMESLWVYAETRCNASRCN